MAYPEISIEYSSEYLDDLELWNISVINSESFCEYPISKASSYNASLLFALCVFGGVCNILPSELLSPDTSSCTYERSIYGFSRVWFVLHDQEDRRQTEICIPVFTYFVKGDTTICVPQSRAYVVYKYCRACMSLIVYKVAIE